MIIRTGNRHVTANVEYHPWSGDHEVSPPTVRKATPEDLARLDAPDVMPRIIDAIGLIPKPIRGVYTDAEKSDRARAKGGQANALRASALRGSEATAQRHPRPKAQRHPDDVVIAAVLAHRGNRAAAGRALGVSEQVMHRRIAFLKVCGRLPAEVSALIAGRKGGMR